MAESGTFDIKDSIATSVADLFDTMLDMEATPFEEQDVLPLDGRCIIGTLSFAGEVIGNIDIQLSDEASRMVTAAMLGMEPEDIEDDEEIKDVVREVCNIVGGNLKSGFEDVGKLGWQRGHVYLTWACSLSSSRRPGRLSFIQLVRFSSSCRSFWLISTTPMSAWLSCGALSERASIDLRPETKS